MEVTAAKVRSRHVDTLGGAQARHSVPRLARVHVELAQRAAARNVGRQEVASGGSSVRARAAAEVRAETERARKERERAERIARLLAEGVANTRMTFHVDNDTGDVTIKVIDNTTGEVVRRIPPEELETIADRMRRPAGLLVDRRR